MEYWKYYYIPREYSCVHLDYTREAWLPVVVLVVFVLSTICIIIHGNIAQNNWFLVMVSSAVEDSLIRRKFWQTWYIQHLLFGVWSQCCFWTLSLLTRAMWCILESVLSITIFLIGSIKQTAKMWYIHSGKCLQINVGHEYEINLVLFLPDINSFDTGSNDSACRLFDMRCYRELKLCHARI